MRAVSKTRAKRRAQTGERIVEAALALVTTEGFEALTMKRLADELDYAAGALYRYFPSKDLLLLAVQRRVLEALAEDMVEAEAKARAHLGRTRTLAEPVAALVPLLAVVRCYVTLAERRAAHAHLLDRWLGSPEPMVATDAAAPVLGTLVGLFESVPRLFEEAARGGAIGAGDPLRRAFVLWSGVQGALQVRKLDRFGVDAFRQEPLIEELCRALFVGWGATDDTFADAWRRVQRLS